MFTIIGFVLAHLVFVGIYFTQLWLVRERGFDAAGIARQVGAISLAAASSCSPPTMLGLATDNAIGQGRRRLLSTTGPTVSAMVVRKRRAPI